MSFQYTYSKYYLGRYLYFLGGCMAFPPLSLSPTSYRLLKTSYNTSYIPQQSPDRSGSRSTNTYSLFLCVTISLSGQKRSSENILLHLFLRYIRENHAKKTLTETAGFYVSVRPHKHWNPMMILIKLIYLPLAIASWHVTSPVSIYLFCSLAGRR